MNKISSYHSTHRTTSDTGSDLKSDNYKEIHYPLDKYEITVRLSLDNRFIGVTEIKVNKDFLTHSQRISPKGFHDYDKYYLEE